ncbi:MAG TPA: LemA family protein [Bryobacteraceae bacterium]|nr:LemA family protein [Bryobacteraceae bacterium]
MLKKLLIVVPLLIVVGVAAASKLLDVHRDLANQRHAIPAQWTQVDLALEQRADLIGNLADAIHPHAKPETAIFQKVAEARAALRSSRTPQEQIEANDRLSDALGRLLVTAENYPRLRSNENFLSLQDEIASSENRIAIERRKYNEILEHYNAQIQRFPDNVVASMSGFRRNDAYFQTDSANPGAPKAQF